MKFKEQFVLLTALLLALVGCTKDPAKIVEAKSLAICDCEASPCVDSVLKEFQPREDAVKGASVNDEQKERINLAQERTDRCLEKLGYTQ